MVTFPGCGRRSPAPRPACRQPGGGVTSLSWTRMLLPRSLRSRLILSFGVLIFLSLFRAGTTRVYLLRDQQEKSARERVGLLAEPIAQRAAILEATGATPPQIEQSLEDEYDVRILLVDRNA